MDFDGINDYVQIGTNSGSPSIPFLPEFSLVTWVRLPDPILNGVIYSALDGTNGTGGFYLAIESGQIKFYVGKTNSPSTPSNVVSYTPMSSDLTWGRWVQIAAVWSSYSKYQQLYINGTLKAQNTSNIFDSYYSTNITHYIGKKPSGTFFTGRIFDHRLYRGAVDAAKLNRMIYIFDTFPDPFPGSWN